jgi:hypothetical protein
MVCCVKEIPCNSKHRASATGYNTYLHVGVLAFLKTHVAAVLFGRADLKKQRKKNLGYYKFASGMSRLLSHTLQTFVAATRDSAKKDKESLKDYTQCCRSRRFIPMIPDPDFYPSRILDLGSRTQQATTATKEGEKN